MENLKPEHILGKISEEEAKGAVDEAQFEAPPIESILNLYDLEQVAHASMKDTSWGYYTTGSMDEFTKCFPFYVHLCFPASVQAGIFIRNCFRQAIMS